MQMELRWQAVYQYQDRLLKADRDDLFFRRFKLRSNWWISKQLFHHFQFEAKDGDPYLEDAYLLFKPTRGWKVRAGQFKNPISRSLISSSSVLPFVDRPLAAKVFAGANLEDRKPSKLGSLYNHGIGRNPGLQVSHRWQGRSRRSQAKLSVQVQQGVRRSQFDEGHSYATRLELYPLGDPGYRVGAYQRKRDPRLALELSFFRDPGTRFVDLNRDGLKTHLDEQRRQVSNLGFHYSQRRFSATGEFLRQWSRPLTTGQAGSSSDGYYVQASWLFHPEGGEVSLRHGQVDPLQGFRGDLQRETTISVARYFGKTTRKLALVHNRLRDEARPWLDESRISLSWSFDH
jgi:hypothetical protein